MTTDKAKISEVGEKALIRNFIKPLFNANNDPFGVGDDCAMVPLGDQIVLLSTDRVPADLIAFRLGILDHAGLGGYLARLNLSDIAACGGRPLGLLLNLGLPPGTAESHVKALCRGFGEQASKFGCKVLGGDITSSNELSASATSIGLVHSQRVLMRCGAKVGDTVFVSRPVGITPAAFEYFLGGSSERLAPGDESLLRAQFTSMDPMIELGQKLAASGSCTSCMDNTDGIGQSFTELAEASDVSLVIDQAAIAFPKLVVRIGSMIGKRPVEFVYNGGADFSLVGTLRGEWNSDEAKLQFGSSVDVVGRVQTGRGVRLVNGDESAALIFKGWNYFLDPLIGQSHMPGS